MYQKTYHGHKYNQDFVHTIVILAVLIAFVMLVVGSNVAGAFTMMGALSIIRFRNSLKNTRDIGFIFFAIAIGMAMGTRMYIPALMATPMILAIFLFLDKKNLFFGEKNLTKTLKIQIADTPQFQHIFDEILQRHCEYFSLDAVQTFTKNISENSETQNIEYVKELTFTLIHRPTLDMNALFSELSVKNSFKNITLFAA